MSDLLEAVGLTREELQSRVVDKIVGLVMSAEVMDSESGESYLDNSAMAEALSTHVKDAVDAKVTEIAARYVVPQIGDIVENFTLQSTNAWGEKVGSPVTFTGYLVQRAEAWVKEPVNSRGETKDESRDSYFKSNTTRISFLIDQHLKYAIETAMKQALKTANEAIVGGIEAAVKMKLAEIAAGIKASVKVG